MPHIIVNSDTSISDVISESNDISIKINKLELTEISLNEFGHIVFDYVNGKVVLNKKRHGELILAKEKSNYINFMIDVEIRESAKKRIFEDIIVVRNCSSIDELDKIRGN